MARKVCVLVLLLSGCGDGDRPPPPPPTDNVVTIPRDQVANGDTRNVIALGACDEGEVRECRFYSDPHGNVQSCFVGEQQCVGETWSDCGEAIEVDAATLDDDEPSEDEPASSGY
jgi:hypothetical protein